MARSSPLDDSGVSILRPIEAVNWPSRYFLFFGFEASSPASMIPALQSALSIFEGITSFRFVLTANKKEQSHGQYIGDDAATHAKRFRRLPHSSIVI